MKENDVGARILDVAVAMHRGLGPGLLESVYEIVLASELQRVGIKVERQVPVSVRYNGIICREGFRADLIVNERVIVEVKSVSALNDSHRKPLLTYLRLADMRLGYLLNFHSDLMKNGIIRVVNGLATEG